MFIFNKSAFSFGMKNTVYQFNVQDINGKEYSMKNFNKKALLIVNTARQ